MKNRVSKIVFKGIDLNDYPKFTDAYIESATIDGKELTEEEIEELEKDNNWFYQELQQYINKM